MRKKKGIGNGIILWIIGIYLLFPLFLTFLYSLFTEWITILPDGFSLNGYLELFGDFHCTHCSVYSGSASGYVCSGSLSSGP